MSKTSGGPGSGGPMMVRRQLGRRLRAMREATGRSRDDVVASKLMSRSKLEGIEHGRTMVRPGDAYELGCIYGASPEELEALRAMATATNKADWWAEYGEGMLKGFNTYLDLEANAISIHVYQPSVIVGLLQTEEYARAVERSSSRQFRPQEVEQNVRLRMERQRILLGETGGAQVHVVLGEAALRCRIGGEDVLREQLAHLREASEAERVDVRILPHATGAHPGILGPFTIFEFDDPKDPTVTCIEGYTTTRYNDQRNHVEHYRQVFNALRDTSVPVEEFPL